MLFSAVIFIIFDDFTRSWQWYANSCTAFFHSKPVEEAAHAKKIHVYIYSYYHMNIDVYKKYNKDIFLSVQYLRLFSSGSVCDGFC